MKVNNLIFHELLKRGYRLEGKTRVWDLADSKLWYLTPKQAQGFLDLEKSKGYKEHIIEKEVLLIKSHLDEIVKKLPFKYCNLIDLGCGDGKKAALFIHELNKFLTFRYCPIDISSYMVSKAAQNIRKLKVGEVLEFRWNISDFENLENSTPLFRDRKFNHHFMLLLGNTFGNFDKGNLLSGIVNSMNKTDVLLIGNGISNGREREWVEDYRDEQINKWLIKIPELLGFNKNEVSYDVRFVDSRIEEMYIVKKDKLIKHLGKSILLKKGDVIIAAISYKYSKRDLKRIIRKFFSDITVYTDSEKSYALALCRK
jgi:uncharacterized SAM-dependent methyltransferase